VTGYSVTRKEKSPILEKILTEELRYQITDKGI